MISLSASSFVMGENPDDKFATDTERPAHHVRFAKSFALAAFPVTAGEYRAFQQAHDAEDPDHLPVVNVTWDDARAYCAWLNAQTGEALRLPTEAEWEYACRAGARTPFAGGTEITPAEANFMYGESGERIGVGHRTASGQYPPNAYGFQDLHGNVCEWTEDTWHPDYHGAPSEGSAWTTGGDPDRRVIRGGAWDYLPRLLRSAWRDGLSRHHRRDNVGFRLAQQLGS